jgi:hypothetical protein
MKKYPPKHIVRKYLKIADDIQWMLIWNNIKKKIDENRCMSELIAKYKSESNLN